jgi:hypothetical protein
MYASALPKARRKAEGEKLKAEEFEVKGALARGFECLTSDFRLQTSDFTLPTLSLILLRRFEQWRSLQLIPPQEKRSRRLSHSIKQK